MHRYGFKDRHGDVTICYSKDEALRIAANSITGRYVAVVLVNGEWREFLDGAPARPLKPRRVPRRSAGVARGSQGLFYRLWRKLRPDSGPSQEFLRHNG